MALPWSTPSHTQRNTHTHTQAHLGGGALYNAAGKRDGGARVLARDARRGGGVGGSCTRMTAASSGPNMNEPMSSVSSVVLLLPCSHHVCAHVYILSYKSTRHRRVKKLRDLWQRHHAPSCSYLVSTYVGARVSKLACGPHTCGLMWLACAYI